MNDEIQFLFFEVSGRQFPIMFPFIAQAMPQDLIKKMIEDKELIVRFDPTSGHVEAGYEDADNWVMTREGAKPAPASSIMEFGVAQVPFLSLFSDKNVQEHFGYDVVDLRKQAERLKLDVFDPNLITRIIPKLKIIEVGHADGKWAIGTSGLAVSKLPCGLNPCSSYKLFVSQEL